jgi:hypothetical protein
MRAVKLQLRLHSVVASENPRRPGRQRQKVTEGAGNTKRTATGVTTGEARYLHDKSDSYDPEVPTNSTRASRDHFGGYGIARELDTL